MEWQDDFAIGIKEIDAQHRKLIGFFSEIMAAIESELGWSEIHFRIVALKNFAAFHFEFEEALMRLFGYAESDDHEKDHKQFFVKLNTIEQTSILTEVKQEMVALQLDWMFSHILTADKRYADHIISRVTSLGA